MNTNLSTNYRAPSMIQMRLLQALTIDTLGPELKHMYEELYDYKVLSGTFYTTLNVMYYRGWVEKHSDTVKRNQNWYGLTKKGKSVLEIAQDAYRRAAEGRNQKRKARQTA